MTERLTILRDSSFGNSYHVISDDYPPVDASHLCFDEMLGYVARVMMVLCEDGSIPKNYGRPPFLERPEAEQEKDARVDAIIPTECDAAPKPIPIRAGDTFGCKKHTEFHWQVSRHASNGTLLFLWNIYPTKQKVCIDPNHSGPPIHIKKWSGLTLEQCSQAAMDACVKQGGHQ